jgi:hypothetical protein
LDFLSNGTRLDLFYPLINDPDLINDPVAQLILAVRCNPQRSEGSALGFVIPSAAKDLL